MILDLIVDIYEKEDIFYCDEIPSMKKLREKGINCAGLINVMRMYSGREIPAQNDELIVRGGTRFWYNYFDKLGKLELFDYENSRNDMLRKIFITHFYRNSSSDINQEIFNVYLKLSTSLKDQTLAKNLILDPKLANLNNFVKSSCKTFRHFLNLP